MRSDMVAILFSLLACACGEDSDGNEVGVACGTGHCAKGAICAPATKTLPERCLARENDGEACTGDAECSSGRCARSLGGDQRCGW